MKRLRARSSAGTDIVESAPRRLIRSRAAPEGTDVESTRDVAESPARNVPSTDSNLIEASMPTLSTCMPTAARASIPIVVLSVRPRLEEHTSELQSRENLVCRLLLEKRNKLVNE